MPMNAQAKASKDKTRISFFMMAPPSPAYARPVIRQTWHFNTWLKRLYGFRGSLLNIVRGCGTSYLAFLRRALCAMASYSCIPINPLVTPGFTAGGFCGDTDKAPGADPGAEAMDLPVISEATSLQLRRRRARRRSECRGARLRSRGGPSAYPWSGEFAACRYARTSPGSA